MPRAAHGLKIPLAFHNFINLIEFFASKVTIGIFMSLFPKKT